MLDFILIIITLQVNHATSFAAAAMSRLVSWKRILIS